MKDDARQAAELEALQAEFAAYRTEAEAKIAELETALAASRIAGAVKTVDPAPLVDTANSESPFAKAVKKPRKPRPTKGK